MPMIRKTLSTRYTPSQLFALVNHVEAYPEFLPHCQEAIIHTRSMDEVCATLRFMKGGVSHSFMTRNRIQNNKMIEMRLVDGPFRSLEGFWHFEEESQGACMHFYLQFEFANRLLSLTTTPLLQWVANKTMQAFSERADKLYGKR